MVKKKKSLGQEIIEGLTELRDAARSKTPLREKFRTVELPAKSDRSPRRRPSRRAGG